MIETSTLGSTRNSSEVGLENNVWRGGQHAENRQMWSVDGRSGSNVWGYRRVVRFCPSTVRDIDQIDAVISGSHNSTVDDTKCDKLACFVISWESEVASSLTAPLSSLPDELKDELAQFAVGLEAEQPPTKEVVDMATRILHVVVENAPVPDVIVDTAGALSFDMRLNDRRLIMAELEADGSINVGEYDAQDELIKFIPLATEAEFISILKA